MKKMCPHLQSINKTQHHENQKKIIQILIKNVFFVNEFTIRNKNDRTVVTTCDRIG